MYCLFYSRILFEKPYTWKETRILLLRLSQVSSCSVLINLRNSVLNLAVFTTVFEFKIGFSGVNKHSLLPWQQLSYDLNNGHFRTFPVDIYLHANLSWGSKFFISHFVWFLQRIALKKLVYGKTKDGLPLTRIPLDTFWQRFVENGLPWLRNMMSQVACGHAIFEKECPLF